MEGWSEGKREGGGRINGGNEGIAAWILDTTKFL